MYHGQVESRENSLQCQVCGAEILPGGVFYIARTEIISGSDGILPDTEQSPDLLIETALQEIMRGKDEQQLMEEVYQEIKLILCGRCRRRFRDAVLNMIKF